MHLQCTMSSIFDWEVRRLGMRDTLRHGTITVSGFGYFHKNCRFLWEKKVSKTNLGSTIHYTYTSYNKQFRLCMVSEELRLMKSISSFSSIESTPNFFVFLLLSSKYKMKVYHNKIPFLRFISVLLPVYALYVKSVGQAIVFL